MPRPLTLANPHHRLVQLPAQIMSSPHRQPSTCTHRPRHRVRRTQTLLQLKRRQPRSRFARHPRLCPVTSHLLVQTPRRGMLIHGQCRLLLLHPPSFPTHKPTLQDQHTTVPDNQHIRRLQPRPAQHNRLPMSGLPRHMVPRPPLITTCIGQMVAQLQRVKVNVSYASLVDGRTSVLPWRH